VTIKLPTPGATYDQTDESNMRQLVEQALNQALSSNATIELPLGCQIIMRDPLKRRWQISIGANGNLLVTAL
jgi:hypothetical protein